MVGRDRAARDSCVQSRSRHSVWRLLPYPLAQMGGDASSYSFEKRDAIHRFCGSVGVGWGGRAKALFLPRAGIFSIISDETIAGVLSKIKEAGNPHHQSPPVPSGDVQAVRHKGYWAPPCSSPLRPSSRHSSGIPPDYSEKTTYVVRVQVSDLRNPTDATTSPASDFQKLHI